MPALPIPPRITLRTAFNRLPVGLVLDLDARLRQLGATDRLDEVLEEFKQVRIDCGMPPLAQPVGGILAGQAVRHVLSARRWHEVSPDMRDYLSGVYGTPPTEVAPEAAAHAVPVPAAEPGPDIDELRAEGLAASEEDLLLVALFGEDANHLLATLRTRGERDETEQQHQKGDERSHRADFERQRRVLEAHRMRARRNVHRAEIAVGAIDFRVLAIYLRDPAGEIRIRKDEISGLRGVCLDNHLTARVFINHDTIRSRCRRGVRRWGGGLRG